MTYRAGYLTYIDVAIQAAMQGYEHGKKNPRIDMVLTVTYAGIMMMAHNLARNYNVMKP